MPETLVDRSNQIQTACFDEEGATFIVTGRGGLTPNPRSRLLGRTNVAGQIELVAIAGSRVVDYVGLSSSCGRAQ
ncbi:MAG: hypothetical protein MJA27_22970 [Pseudanabaenales cyanobacterium]|nr:hypothetical protein [Pseudanabaenales cyanobacterium]